MGPHRDGSRLIHWLMSVTSGNDSISTRSRWIVNARWRLRRNSRSLTGVIKGFEDTPLTSPQAVRLLGVFRLYFYEFSLQTHGLVTHKFPDGNFARPRLGIFAFRSAQTKIYLRLPQKHKIPSSRDVRVFCGPTGNRTPDSSMPWTRVTTILWAPLSFGLYLK